MTRIKCRWCAAMALFVACCSCNTQESEKPVEVFSEAKPLSLEIKRERSFYQAEKIARRLNSMGVEAYIIAETESDGTWYKVTSGAFENADSVERYITKLDTLFNIKAAKTVDYAKLDSVSRLPVKSIAAEKHRIAANTPDVPAEIMDVVKKYPQNDMFYIKNIGMLCLNSAGIRSSDGRKIDMPRGISLSFLRKRGCTAISSVIYTDNIFGDNVTLQVVRHGKSGQAEGDAQVIKASLLPLPTATNSEVVELCSDIADEILKTGSYANEQKQPISVEAYTTLEGYLVSFDTKKARRSYYILTDQAGEYIYMAQSTERSGEEMLDFMAEIGRSEGLVMYDEFYNTFYTISDEQTGNDEFAGYYMEKLGWSYAKSKNYQTWAKKMVGHWQASLFFSNDKKGEWQYSIFDLLTDSKRGNIYNNIYLKGDNADLRKVYGVDGRAVYFYNWWLEEQQLTEINFGFDRYVVALNGTDNYSERDLIMRAEDLQFMRGGYSEEAAEEPAENDAPTTKDV